MSRPRSISLMNPEYEALASEQNQYLQRLGYSPDTCIARYHYLREFLSWKEQRGELDIYTTTAEQIKEYHQYLSQRKSKQTGGLLHPKSIYDHIKLINDLFVRLETEGRIKSNPFNTLDFEYPGENNQREILTQEQIKELYQSCITAQERAILSLAYGCGLRADELEKVNIEDLMLREKILVVPKGKGNKRRLVPMSTGVVKDLQYYYEKERAALALGIDFDKNRADNRKAFMLHSRGGRMRSYTYNKYLKAIIERTENTVITSKQISIHNLRHSIATHLLEQGIPTDQLRLFLGHSQMETTQIYTHISSAQIQQLNDDT